MCVEIRKDKVGSTPIRCSIQCCPPSSQYGPFHYEFCALIYTLNQSSITLSNFPYHACVFNNMLIIYFRIHSNRSGSSIQNVRYIINYQYWKDEIYFLIEIGKLLFLIHDSSSKFGNNYNTCLKFDKYCVCLQIEK